MRDKDSTNISDIGDEIEDVVDAAENVHELQSNLISLVQEYFKKKDKNTNSVKNKKTKTRDEKIAKELTKFTNDLMKKYQELDPDIGKSNTDSENYPLDKKAKITMKRLIKEFAVYEIYKVMNPKRIAGETKKDNFAHNMAAGGYKRASKYEGGKKSDVKSYGTGTVQRIERASRVFRGRGGFEL